MDERIILLIVFSFLLIPSLNAVPPFQSTSFSEGFNVQLPQDNVLKQNQDYTFEFHISNISNGRPITSGINCTFHLYNSTGNHIFTGYDDTVSESLDYSFKVLGGNFSKLESQYYFISCNNTVLGGFGESITRITYNGEELQSPQSILYSSLFIIFILLLIAIPFLTTFLPSSDTKDEEGRLMQISWLKYFRPILWFTEWMMAIALFYISSNLAFAYLNETLFATILLTIFRIMFGVTPLIVIVWMVWFFVHFFQDKQFQNMINRGIFPQGKL